MYIEYIYSIESCNKCMKFDDVFKVLTALLDGFNASVEIQSYSVID